MAEKTFIDVYGLRFHTNGSPVGKRKQHYAIIKRKDEILCQYNKADKLFCIPKSADIVQKRKPKKSFSVDTVWKISVALDIAPGLLFEIDMEQLVNQ